MSAPGPGLTCDRFLDGRLSVWQPARGYRAGLDAVLLAAAARVRPGDSVLDLGCGVGVAALCLGWRVPGARLTGLEVQTGYADLATRNAAENRIAFEVVTGDLSRMPGTLKVRRFDHVISNPPYFVALTRSPARDPGRETAHAAPVPLSVWVDAACRRLRPGGRMTIIQRADRLPDLLAACDTRLGRLCVQPLQPRIGQAAHLVLLSAEKGGRTPFALKSPIPLHAGGRHESDAESYTESIRAVLRDGMPLI